MNGKELFSKMFRFFLRGLLYTVPLAVTVYIIYNLFLFIDGLIPLKQRGFGIIIVFALVTGIGILGSSFLARPLMNYFNGLIDRVPLVKTIYTSIRDLMSAFVGEKKRFDKPVMVKVNKDSGLEKLGFITSEDLSAFGLGQDKIAVYLPHSYNFSGNLFIVDRSSITLLEANSAEVMKFIVSGGVTAIEQSSSTKSKTMSSDKINTQGAPKPVGAYPHARKVGDLLFLSGVGPRVAGSDSSDSKVPGLKVDANGHFLEFDFEAQCRSVFDNVRAVLDASGSSWDKLVDVTVFLVDMKRDFKTYNRIYAEYFKDNQPCRTTIEINALPTPIAIELKCIATM